MVFPAFSGFAATRKATAMAAPLLIPPVIPRSAENGQQNEENLRSTLHSLLWLRSVVSFVAVGVVLRPVFAL